MEVINTKKSHRFTMDERLEAVRSFLFKERTRVSICKSLVINKSSFDDWRSQLEDEIYRRHDYKELPLYVMKSKKTHSPGGTPPETPETELSRLRRENQLLKVHLDGYEILARLALEKYGIDLKKNFGEKSSPNNITGKEVHS